jgi:hypothetical protein
VEDLEPNPLTGLALITYIPRERGGLAMTLRHVLGREYRRINLAAPTNPRLLKWILGWRVAGC